MINKHGFFRWCKFGCVMQSFYFLWYKVKCANIQNGRYQLSACRHHSLSICISVSHLRRLRSPRHSPTYPQVWRHLHLFKTHLVKHPHLFKQGTVLKQNKTKKKNIISSSENDLLQAYIHSKIYPCHSSKVVKIALRTKFRQAGGQESPSVIHRYPFHLFHFVTQSSYIK